LLSFFVDDNNAVAGLMIAPFSNTSTGGISLSKAQVNTLEYILWCVGIYKKMYLPDKKNITEEVLFQIPLFTRKIIT
jgi:hypothetical protein